jgi:hypothetical protein
MEVSDTQLGDVTAVRRAVDRLIDGSSEALLDLLTNEVELDDTGGGRVPSRSRESGKQAVADYFTALGALVEFWQVEYSARGRRVIVRVMESFTIQHLGLDGGCELALVFELSGGLVTRLQVIEDLRSSTRGGNTFLDASRADGIGRTRFGAMATAVTSRTGAERLPPAMYFQEER